MTGCVKQRRGEEKGEGLYPPCFLSFFFLSPFFLVGFACGAGSEIIEGGVRSSQFKELEERLMSFGWHRGCWIDGTCPATADEVDTPTYLCSIYLISAYWDGVTRRAWELRNRPAALHSEADDIRRGLFPGCLRRGSSILSH